MEELTGEIDARVRVPMYVYNVVHTNLYPYAGGVCTCGKCGDPTMSMCCTYTLAMKLQNKDSLRFDVWNMKCGCMAQALLHESSIIRSQCLCLQDEVAERMHRKCQENAPHWTISEALPYRWKDAL